MNKSQLLWLLLAMPLSPYPCLGQGMVEAGATQASVAGLGAGLAASLNHGRVVHHSYRAAVNAQQAPIIQTKAIEQYMKIGCEQESRKKWADAEESFRYVLRVIARRDGPGSPKSLPALEHLVLVTQSQHKIEDAISYQKTVIAFKQSVPMPDVSAIVKAKSDLSNLYQIKGDYLSAEPLLRDAVAICDAHKSSLSTKQRREVLIYYAKLLRKLNKDTEAQAAEVEAEKLKDQKTAGQ